MLLSILFCGFIVNLPTLQMHDTALGSLGLQYFSYLFYHNELVISDEMLGRMITVVQKAGTGDPPANLKLAGEEVLAHLGYALNCSRVGGSDDLACWYDVAVPLISLLAVVALAALLLTLCGRDPH